MRYDISDIKNKLKENYSQFAKEYAAEIEASYRKKVMNTKPGDAAPGRGFTEKESAAFRIRTNAYRQRAEAIIANAKEQIAADVTEAPSAEAVSYISLLSKREHVSPYEIQFAANAYGKNFACYSAIQEVAVKNKIYIDNHPTQAALDDIQAFEQSNSYYSLDVIGKPDRKPEITAKLYAAGIDGTLFGEAEEE